MPEKKGDEYRKEHNAMLEKMKDVEFCPECGVSFKVKEGRICPHCGKSKWTSSGFVIVEKAEEKEDDFPM